MRTCELIKTGRRDRGDGGYRALVVLAAGTGLRQGECFGLTVDGVDFLRRQVGVDRQRTSARGGVAEFGAS